jgi:hypothetical protein
MKNRDPWLIFIPAFAVLFFSVAIGVNLFGVRITQQALNEQCGTDYSLIQVALAGDNLSRLCQIKNQTVTVK